MRALLASLLVFAFAAVALAQSLASGTWRSDYGDSTGNAPWYICVVPNGGNFKFYATYSRIGFVEGDILSTSPNTMNGFYWEAGLTFDLDGDTQSFGGFHGTITLTRTGLNTISGTYTDSITGTGTWSLTRVDDVTPADTLCWSSPTTITTGSIAGGGWGNTSAAANWDFCTGTPDPSIAGAIDVESAYDFSDPPNSDVVGASFGLCYSGGTVCTFIYTEEIGGVANEGQWLMRQVDSDTFYAFGWTGYPNENDPGVNWYTTNPDEFGFYVWSKNAGVSGSCTRNNYLYGGAASSLVASVAVIALGLLFALAL